MLRALRTTPRLAVAALAAGLAGALVLLAVVEATLVRPLPAVPRPDRVVTLVDSKLSYPSLSGFVAAARHNPAIVAFGGYSQRWFAVELHGESRRRRVTVVSGDYFEVAGTSAARGRLLGAGDERPGAAPAAVISNDFWREAFGSSDDVVGSRLTLNGASFTVVGVAAPGFRGFERSQRPELWVSASAWIAAAPSRFAGLTLDRWGWSWIRPLARLDGSASFEAAAAALQIEADRQFAEQPRYFRSRPEISLRAATLAAVGLPSAAAARWVSAATLGLVILLVVLAASSAAHLFLARGEERRRELALRIALGAERRRLATMMLREPLLAAAVSVPFAVVISRLTLLRLAAQPLPGGLRLGDLGLDIDLRVVLAGAVVALFTGLAAGLLPIVHVWRQDVARSLGGRELGHRIAERGRSLLVATQVGLSLVLVAATSLCVRALDRAAMVETGFDGARVGFVELDAGLLRSGAERARDLYRRALAATEARPEVASAALASRLPLDPSVDVETAAFSGYTPAAGENPEVEPALVGPRALSTLGIRILAGREIDERDRAGSEPVAVISSAAARRWFVGRDPIGQQIQLDTIEATIVGVTADVHAHGLAQLQPPAVYLAYEQVGDVLAAVPMAVVFRGRTAAAPALAAALQAIRGATPELPAEPSGTFADLYAATVAPQRLGAAVFGLFAAVGTLLAAVGLYGLVAHGAKARTREIGLRMALGAQRGALLSRLTRLALRPAATGAAIGIVLSLGVGLGARGLAFGFERLDLAAPLVATMILIVTAAVSAAIPAWRTAGLDPVAALREE